MSMQKGREITISVLKYNPRSKVSKPHFVEFKLEETPGMTLFIALNLIRENYDAETAGELERRLINSIRSGDSAKFTRGVRKIKDE